MFQGEQLRFGCTLHGCGIAESDPGQYSSMIKARPASASRVACDRAGSRQLTKCFTSTSTLREVLEPLNQQVLATLKLR